LGLLRTAPAVGALTLSLFFGRHPIRRHAGRIMFAAVATFGIATVVFGSRTGSGSRSRRWSFSVPPTS